MSILETIGHAITHPLSDPWHINTPEPPDDEDGIAENILDVALTTVATAGGAAVGGLEGIAVGLVSGLAAFPVAGGKLGWELGDHLGHNTAARITGAVIGTAAGIGIDCIPCVAQVMSWAGIVSGGALGAVGGGSMAGHAVHNLFTDE